MHSKISVVIPVYCHTNKHEQYLIEALHSVANQTFKDIEVIIVDDASPHNILPIIKQFTSDLNIRVIRNKENLKHIKSRNIGITESTTDIIAFLDNDDVWLPDKLEKQYNMLQNTPDAAMVFCGLDVFGDNTSILDFDQSIIPERPDFLWFYINENYVISATAVMVRKQALLDIDLFDSRYTSMDDFDAWLKVVQNNTIIYMPKKLAKYRLHKDNLNYSFNKKIDTKLLYAVYYKYWRNSNINIKNVMLKNSFTKKKIILFMEVILNINIHGIVMLSKKILPSNIYKNIRSVWRKLH